MLEDKRCSGLSTGSDTNTPALLTQGARSISVLHPYLRWTFQTLLRRTITGLLHLWNRRIPALPPSKLIRSQALESIPKPGFWYRSKVRQSGGTSGLALCKYGATLIMEILMPKELDFGSTSLIDDGRQKPARMLSLIAKSTTMATWELT